MALLSNSLLCRLSTYLHCRRIVTEWKRQGRPLPPPHYVKQRIVVGHMRHYGLKVFVETGTFLGDMIKAVINCAAEIHSVEIEKSLFDQAKKQFREHGHVAIHHGDSAIALPQLLSSLRGPCLFWLDGHYSGRGTGRGDAETPILHEIHAVLSLQRGADIILIDDARLFIGRNGYPSISELKATIARLRPSASIENDLDIIRILPDGDVTKPPIAKFV